MDDRAQRRRHERWLLKFYNEIAGTKLASFEEIPQGSLRVLAFLDYETIIEPFLATDLLGGASREIGPIRYGVTEAHARKVGEKYKAFPRKKNYGQD